MATLTSEQARRGARLLAWGRVGLGVLALAAPTIPARTWIGAEARGAGARTLARSLGGRDLALGVGTLLALRHGTPVRDWVEAGALADASDVAGTVLAWRALPRRGRGFTAVIATGALAASRIVAAAVDEGRDG